MSLGSNLDPVGNKVLEPASDVGIGGTDVRMAIAVLFFEGFRGQLAEIGSLVRLDDWPNASLATSSI